MIASSKLNKQWTNTTKQHGLALWNASVLNTSHGFHPKPPKMFLTISTFSKRKTYDSYRMFRRPLFIPLFPPLISKYIPPIIHATTMRPTFHVVIEKSPNISTRTIEEHYYLDKARQRNEPLTKVDGPAVLPPGRIFMIATEAHKHPRSLLKTL